MGCNAIVSTIDGCVRDVSHGAQPLLLLLLLLELVLVTAVQLRQLHRGKHQHSPADRIDPFMCSSITRLYC